MSKKTSVKGLRSLLVYLREVDNAGAIDKDAPNALIPLMVRMIQDVKRLAKGEQSKESR